MSESKRTFEDKPATLEKVPLLVGIVGPSNSGKTYSALRLATGIQRVIGGDIGFIDTEARRSLHYSSKFKFRHTPFGAPFSPLDYLAAVEHFVVKKGVKTIIVDSMSHEHEGPGGVLEEHDEETTRLAALWKCSRDTAQMSAWAQPKAKRRRFINTLLQMDINAIFCFRAKEKIKPVKGGKPQELGFMPIAGEEFVYEMTANCLLYPGSAGVPTWKSDEVGERLIIKRPEQFTGILKDRSALSEDMGEAMAKWAMGGSIPEAEKTPEPQPKPRTVKAECLAILNSIGISELDKVSEWVGRKLAREVSKESPVSEEEWRTLIEHANAAKEIADHSGL